MAPKAVASATATLSAAQARRVALAAQGFGERRPARHVDRRQVRRVVDRLGQIQIDSVNVLVRAHELPLYGRLGPYPRSLLSDAAERHRDVFEYLGHAACFLPTDSHPLWRWRMGKVGDTWRGDITRIEQARPGYVDAVLAELQERGPLSAAELTDGGTSKGPWWDWADGKAVLEYLWWAGRVSVAGRRNGFERVYDLTERVIPAAILAVPTPSIDDAHRELVRRAARALGVATRRDLYTYFYLRADLTGRAISDLVDEGELIPVKVEGWKDPAWLTAGARQPRSIDARALVAPFDSLVFDRARVERVFGMRYRIEIYTPAPKRVYGYYVLPFLLGDTLVGRVDLKADRKQSTLLVQAAHAEPGARTSDVAAALAEELRLMADWLELEAIDVRPVGDLSTHLARASGH